MTTQNPQKTGYVKTQTLLFAVFVSFFVGFFAGIVLTIFKTDQMPVSNQQPVNPQQRREAHATQIQQLERVVADNPDNTAAWIQLGHLYFDSEQYTEAIRVYRVALERDPRNADVWTDLGVMYRRNKQPDEAIKSFNRALEVDPRHQIAMYNKGIVFIHDLKDNKAGIDAWTQLVVTNPQAKGPSGELVSDMIKKVPSSP